MKNLIKIIILGLVIVSITSCQKETIRDCTTYEMEYEVSLQNYYYYKTIYDSNPTNGNKYKMYKANEEANKSKDSLNNCKGI